MVKICASCKSEKSISDFIRCSPDKSKFRPDCKSCRIAKKSAYRKTERGKALAIEYARSDRARESLAKYQRTEKGLASLKRNYEKTKTNGRLRARWSVGNAIKNGRLVRSNVCSICGKKAKTHFHHYLGYDLENTLKVKEVCVPCHGEEHRNARI